MEVNVQKAVKMFFSNSSFEMIYNEALANALDAGANEIRINISLPDPTQLQNLQLTISDNGVGFDDYRFGKFSKLFDVEEQSHKGLGRLVYLCYFERVYVESTYNEGTKKRTFTFDDRFNGENTVKDIEPYPCGSSLTMQGFAGERLHRNDNINPNHIKSLLMENFYMRLYKKRLNDERIRVIIESHVGGSRIEAIVDTDDMPDFSILPLEHQLDLFNSIDLYYSVRETDEVGKKPITAIAVDDRCHQVPIIDDENLPAGYEMIFLLISESFQGAIDESRQNLTLSGNDLGNIKRLFREGIAHVINENFPRIAEANKEREESLKNTYPHLSGYFKTSDIGFSSRNDILKDAQEQFFRDQREILSATTLSDEQYEKSLTLAARSLAEYILFRQNVISKMKAFDKANLEADLHNLIAPKGSEFQEGELYKDLYRNNVWVLDDKFMSYCTVLSEAEMSKVIDVITHGEVKDSDDDRPDITLFFSNDPTKEDRMLDVVVVELKRLGIKAEQNSIIEFQLDTRTQRLAEYYGKRIQRMWFYGIVEFDERYETHLVNNEYAPLFSNGSIYFKSKTIYTDKSKSYGVIQNSYIMDFKALVEDANTRNETFLKILKHQFENPQ
ncbi:MAG: sensor histidine kinase [Paludibacteraceae bacterium]|nr:sensor histidine kinase [Paludibacteraceae bacterium]